MTFHLYFVPSLDASRILKALMSMSWKFISIIWALSSWCQLERCLMASLTMSGFWKGFYVPVWWMASTSARPMFIFCGNQIKARARTQSLQAGHQKTININLMAVMRARARLISFPPTKTEPQVSFCQGRDWEKSLFIGLNNGTHQFGGIGGRLKLYDHKSWRHRERERARARKTSAQNKLLVMGNVTYHRWNALRFIIYKQFSILLVYKWM